MLQLNKMLMYKISLEPKYGEKKYCLEPKYGEKGKLSYMDTEKYKKQMIFMKILQKILEVDLIL